MKIVLKEGDVVQLTDGYYIEGIPLNYVLMKSYISCGNGANKTQKPRMINTVVGYYMTVEGAIDGYIREIKRTGAEDFNGDLNEYIKRITDITNNAVEKIVGAVKSGKGI